MIGEVNPKLKGLLVVGYKWLVASMPPGFKLDVVSSPGN